MAAAGRSSGSVLSVLLRVYPAAFRVEYGEEIREIVWSGRAGKAGLQVPLFWLETGWDMVRSGLRLRVLGDRGWSSMGGGEPGGSDGLIRELRYSLRSLIRNPAHTLAVVAVLAIGIGLNASIFGVINGVLLEPLPYPSADRLVYIDSDWEATQTPHAPISGGGAQELIADLERVEEIGAFQSVRQNLTGLGAAAQLEVGWVSAGFFRTLGVEPALGRLPTADDPPATAVISHGFWMERFGGDGDALDRAILLDDRPVNVIGVLPEGFRPIVPAHAGVSTHLPIWRLPDPDWPNGDLWNTSALSAASFRLAGRLEEEATLQQLQTELDRFSDDWSARFPDHASAGLRLEATSLHDAVVGDVRQTLLLLGGAVALVLLIACANVMNLMLVRAQSRGREMALRLALGSGHRRIARGLLMESAALSVLGGAVGVALAVAATRLVVAMGPGGLPRLDNLGVDLRVLIFSLALSGLTAVLFGLAPALSVSRVRLSETLKHGGNGQRGRNRLSRALVVVELSMSLVLLVGAVLLVRSFSNLRSVQPGFDYDDLLTYGISLPTARYDFPVGTHRFFEELMERTEALPGVVRAGVAWPLPFTGEQWSGQYLNTDAGSDGPPGMADYRLVTSGYFETMGTRLVDGRNFDPTNAREVAIINRALAEKLWPGRAAIGRTLSAEPWGQPVRFEVIGVVDDIRYADIRTPAIETIYFDSRGWSWGDWQVGVVVRTVGPPKALVDALRSELRQMDPRVPLANPRSMSAWVDDQLSGTRFSSSVMVTFAMAAGVLALIGLYGVVSFAVGQRRRELGIRVALGSRRKGILALVLGDGLKLTVLGVSIGLVGAWSLTGFLSGLLFEMQATDPVTFTATALLLLATGLAASVAPAVRAIRVDPVEVLKSE